VEPVTRVDDYLVRAELCQIPLVTFVADHGGHCGSEPSCNLDGRGTDAAVCSGDEDVLSGLHAPEAFQSAIGSPERAVEDGGFDCRHSVRDAKEASLRREQVSRVTAVYEQAQHRDCLLAQ